jgi:nicotinate-nucleotide adenylyltransferase
MPPLLEEIPTHVRTLLIFGGTFDPPHIGHVTLPEIVRQHLNLDWALYIPAAAPPLKAGPVASESDRLAMLACALHTSGDNTMTQIEFMRGGTSYTHDTLLALTQQHPDISMRLLIGADQALQFHKWKNAREIITLAEPIVMLRDAIDSAKSLLDQIQDHWTSQELALWEHRFISVPAVDCNSSQIRNWLKNPGVHENQLRKCLPKELLLYLDVTNPYASS